MSRVSLAASWGRTCVTLLRDTPWSASSATAARPCAGASCAWRGWRRASPILRFVFRPASPHHGHHGFAPCEVCVHGHHVPRDTHTRHGPCNYCKRGILCTLLPLDSASTLSESASPPARWRGGAGGPKAEEAGAIGAAGGPISLLEPRLLSRAALPPLVARRSPAELLELLPQAAHLPRVVLLLLLQLAVQLRRLWR